MAELATTQSKPSDDAEYQAAFEALLDEISRLEAEMPDYRVENEKLRARSQAVTQHTDRVLQSVRKQLDALNRIG